MSCPSLKSVQLKQLRSRFRKQRKIDDRDLKQRRQRAMVAAYFYCLRNRLYGRIHDK